MSSRFLQIHTLTNYPACLLNRDDAGFAKRMPFGGAVRTRISSQCLKRHWRVYEGERSLASLKVPESIRSREIFRLKVLPEVAKTPGVSEARARWAVAAMVALLQVGTSSSSKAKRLAVARRFVGEPAAQPDGPRRGSVPGGDGDKAATEVLSQVIVLGPPEIAFLTQEAAALAKTEIRDEDLVEAARTRVSGEQKTNLEALAASVSRGAGISAALFGRMRTGDLFADTDAAVHVAHSMTVHGHMTESDYFTAVDDLVQEAGEQGSGHINASELTSGLFYGYVVVDVNALVSNLGADRALAGDVVDRLVHMVCTVSPGAKKGSTAPYSYSHLVLLESGNRQPRTLQNAFIEPVRANGNLVQNSYAALRGYLAELDATYGKGEQRAHAGLFTGEGTDGRDTAIFENRMPLPDLATWARAQVLA